MAIPLLLGNLQALAIGVVSFFQIVPSGFEYAASSRDFVRPRSVSASLRSSTTSTVQKPPNRRASLLARMREVGPEGVATLAHTLSGSARGIGAWRVAAAAEAAECAVKQSAPLAPAIAGLTACVEEARRAIAGLLDVAAQTG